MPSCYVVRNIAPNTPFVFDTKIVLKGQIASSDKKQLLDNLRYYWDDSLHVTKHANLLIPFRHIINNPIVFDTANLLRTKMFMQHFLYAQGFYHAQIIDSVHIVQKRKQRRVTPIVYITLNGRAIVDSLSYQMADSALQHIANANRGNSFLKKGMMYSTARVDMELNRLENLYKQNGFLRFSREGLFVSVDTLQTDLTQVHLDPFKQVQFIANLKTLLAQPTQWNIEVVRQPTVGADATKQYYFGTSYFYPSCLDTDNVDTLMLKQSHAYYDSSRSIMIVSTKKKFIPSIFKEHCYTKSGELYDEILRSQTINSLRQTGTWREVNAINRVRGDSVDMYYFLVPELKQNYSAALVGSWNSNTLTSSGSAGNLLGLGVNLSYRNRNVWHRAVQLVTEFYIGTEINPLPLIDKKNQDLILQTLQISLSHKYSFPKLMLPFYWERADKFENKHTNMMLNVSRTNRSVYYNLNSVETSWGYDWTQKQNHWDIKLMNIGYYKLDSLQELAILFQSNPLLRNSFRNGVVVGPSVSYTTTFIAPNHPYTTHFFRTGAETSGMGLNYISHFAKNLFQYLKIEGEYRFLHQYTKTELAVRFMGGMGISFQGTSLPVFKQYAMGGPYSMRAWGLRQLGLGSSILVDTSQSTYTERYGDIALEANVEYRFPIFTFTNGTKIASTVFMDMGNIWNRIPQANDPLSVFSIARLPRDLAIDMGTGLRLDLGFVVIRVDAAYKVKDPARQTNSGWMSFDNFKLSETRPNGVVVNNWSIQFGIGYPF